MAKFTAGVPLKIHLPGGFEIDGAAGATHRIPDALYDEFVRDQVPLIPGGVTWVMQDETSAIPTLPIGQTDVSGLTASLAAKYDKTGGTISGAVTVTGVLIAQDSISTPTARFKGVPWHDVRAYGATGDGATDDTSAMQLAVNAATSLGGVIFMPPGTYRITAPLDFSALKGRQVGVKFVGSGSGDYMSNVFSGATIILNDQSSPALKVLGSLAGTSSLSIGGIELVDFVIKNTTNLGSNYTIDMDYVASMCRIANVFIYGQNLTGNGIQFRNFGHGQATFDRVTVRGFSGGTGIRMAVETTPNVDVAPNSGNITLISCLSMDVQTGYEVVGTNLNNSGSLVACKAVNTSDVVGSIGFSFLTNARSWSLVSPHAERFSTGYNIDTAEYISLLAPFSSFPTGTPDANSAGLRIKGAATGIVATACVFQLTHYGVSFEGTARTNMVTGSDRTGARVLTSWSTDSTTNKSNSVWKTEGEPFTATHQNTLQILQSTATQSVLLRIGVNGDTQGRYRQRADGLMEWGGNGSTFDLNLYRSAAAVLATDNTLLLGAALRMSGVISPTSLSASQNNYAPTGLTTSGVIRQAASTNIALTGLTAGVSNQRLLLCNISAFTITLNHGDVNSSAANQFLCPNSANLAIRPNGAVELLYDATSTRWRVMAA